MSGCYTILEGCRAALQLGRVISFGSLSVQVKLYSLNTLISDLDPKYSGSCHVHSKLQLKRPFMTRQFFEKINTF